MRPPLLPASPAGAALPAAPALRLAAVLALLWSGNLPAAEVPFTVDPAADQGGGRHCQPRAVILERAVTLDYTDPGQCVEHERLKVRVLDQRGIEAWGFVRRAFDADSETLLVVSCRTISPDGAVLPLPPNAVNIVAAGEAEDDPGLGGRMEMVVTPLGLAPGAVIELELRRIRDRQPDDPISGERVWQGLDPSLRQSLVLRVPRGRPLLRWRSSKAIREKFSQSDRVTRWEWRADSLSGIPDEEDRPDDAALSHRLLFSDRMDWAQAAARFARDFLPRAQDTADLSPLAATIAPPDGTPLALVNAIATALNRTIRPVDIRFGDDGCLPRRPGETLASRQAGDNDRAALFMALLAIRGIRSHPVLTWDGDEDLVKEIPDLDRLNRVLLAVEDGAGWLYIDPAGDDRLPAFLDACAGRKGLLVKSIREAAWIDLPTAPDGAGTLRFEGRLAPVKKAWRAAGTARMSGRYDQRWRDAHRELSSAERERRRQGYFHRWSRQAAVRRLSLPDEDDVAAPAALSFECDLPGFAREQGRMAVIRIPDQPFAELSLLPWPGAAERRLPLVTDGPLTKELRWRIILPKGWRPAGLPEDVNLDNEAGSVSFRTSADDSAVWFEHRVELRLATAPPERYAQLRALMDACLAPSRWLLLLEKRK